MAKMGGVNEHLGGTRSDAGAQGGGRMAPKSFSRNSLSKGGVNKDLGGGWAPTESDSQAGDLGPGQANDGNPGRQSSAGKSKAAIQKG